MRLPLRLISVLVVSAGLIGIVLALTVFDTDEGPRHKNDAKAQTGETTATGPTGETGPIGATMTPQQEVPIKIDGPLLGVNMTAYSRDGYGTARVQKAMKTLANLGSTAVTLVPTWYMMSSGGNKIAPDPLKTPSTASLEKAVKWAKEAGLQVVMKPHVDVIDDSYRGEIQPTNRDQWFRSYGRFISHFADLSTRNQVEMMVIGTELKTLSGETGRWQGVIQTVRDRFYGPLTYAANWDEVEQVQFWSDLDAIGVDAYYPIADEGQKPTLGSMTRKWRGIARNLKALAVRWSRPMLVTEVGYPSQVGAAARPYEVTDEPADEELQALAYRATFRALPPSSWLAGISWWSWRADSSPTERIDVEYTPEGKKAQGVLAGEQWAYTQ